MPSTTLIAEIGVNHGGRLAAALHLADAAKMAGADVAKYQLAVPELEATLTAPVAPYQAENGVRSQRDMIRDLTLSRDEMDKVIAHCDAIGIEFMCSAGDCDSLRWLLDGRINTIKIGSGDLTNGEMLALAAGETMPILLSTGMATMPEIGRALDYLGGREVTLLQCTSDYPCPVDAANLAAMATMRHEFKRPVGFSDHTLGIAAPVAAVALGSVVIEKHLTLNRLSTGPDHAASMEPFQFKHMVGVIRQAEEAIGSARKAPTPSEMQNAAACRKVLVAAETITAGQCFTPENVTAKRASRGRSALDYYAVMGRRALRDYAPDEPIE